MAKFVFDTCEYNQTDDTRDKNADIYTKIGGGFAEAKSLVVLRTALRKVHMTCLSLPFLGCMYKNISSPFLFL